MMKKKMLFLEEETKQVDTRQPIIRCHLWRSQRKNIFTYNYKKMYCSQLSAACCFILINLSLLATSSAQLDVANFNLQEAATGSGLNHLTGAQTEAHEILIKPFDSVRLECKLPQLKSSEQRSFSWVFQRTSAGLAKPKIVCFDGKCLGDANSFGIHLEMDADTGVYDLLINNATYELHDGLYYCEYEDNTPSSRQSISREYRLTVLIPPQPPTIVASSPSAAREGLEYQLNCQTQGGNPEPNITWYRHDRQIISNPQTGIRITQASLNGTTINSLTWIPSLEDHQAAFKCFVSNKAMSPNSALQQEIRINVEYSPRINVGPFNPLKVLQGSSVTLQCSVDAYPPIKGIRWFKDGLLTSIAYNHTISDVKLTDSSIYSCQADNGIAPAHSAQAIGQLTGSSFHSLLGLSQASSNLDQISSKETAVQAYLQLQVLYPPRVQVRASKVGPLNMDESISLNCSVESWPPPYEFVWTKSDDPSFKRISATTSSVLEFTSVTANDMGNYTCSAYNRMEPSIYPSNQAMPIERSGSGSALVQVRHRPGVAEIVLGQNGVTESFKKTTIECRANPPGFPEPQYTYWKYQGSGKIFLNKQGSVPVYTIHSATAADEGRYGCSASNERGSSSEAEGELIVNEVPVVINDSNRKSHDSRPRGDKPYSITIRASGKPVPRVSWFHRSPIDGRTRIDLSSPEMQSKFKIETVTKPEQGQMKSKYIVITTLIFKNPLEVDDRGLYTVEFNNDLSRSVTEDFQLHINHPPIPAPKNQPLMVNSQQNSRTKAGFNLGETVNLTCRVSAHPKPDIYWHDPSGMEKPIETSSRYRISNSVNPVDDIWESTLFFSLASETDYGDYMCAAANKDPQTGRFSETVQIIVSLTKKTVPDAPYGLEAIDATQDSITIQWIPGFDGGIAYNQYLVQYAPDDGSGLSMGKRFPNADSVNTVLRDYQDQNTAGSDQSDSDHLIQQQQQQQQQPYPRLFYCLATNPCTINHLLPRQAYSFRVLARNALGSSAEFSDELKAMTRANFSQIPKIVEASFGEDNSNILRFKIEPGSEYLLASMNARIEYRANSLAGNMIQADPQNLQQQEQLDNNNNQVSATGAGKWELLTSIPLLRQDKYDARLNMSPDTEQLKITLCLRSADSICGPEYVVSKSAPSLFLQAERGLTLYVLMSTLTLIVVLGAFATTIHSCCLSRKSKKADAIERVDGSIDNKPIANGAGQKSSHGSTTSTNSTSAGNGTTNGLQSMDSINNALNNAASASASDHSSDHSRQAKLDSMLPPNYNHYADRNSIMLEQQQQQQLLQQHQQQGLIADKLGSPFGLPNSALLSVANQQQQQNSPLVGGNYFAYNQAGQVELQQPMSLEHHALVDGTQMSNHMMLNANGQLEPADGGQQMWQPGLDDYNNYNAAAFNYITGAGQANQQELHGPDPTYGTTGSLIMSQQAAAYDNSANSGEQQYYLSAYQDQNPAQQYQRAQYQQEMAVAQQQMYGTLTRNGYSQQQNNTDTLNSKASTQQNNASNQQLIEQQQQYGATNGLAQVPSSQQSLPESDYGTAGARSGRLIREIIV